MGKILPYAIAFAAGLLAAFVDYLVSRATEKKNSAKYYATPVRTLIACVFVVALYIAANLLGVDRLPFLIAGAVGATIGLIVFTVLLIKGGRKDGKKPGEPGGNEPRGSGPAAKDSGKDGAEDGQ